MMRSARFSAFVFAFVGIALSSCSSLEVDDTLSVESRLVDVSITFDGLNITQEPDAPRTNAPRKASDKNANEVSVSRIALSIYDKTGSLVRTFTQSKTDEGFGTINCKLLVGNYTFVAVAHGVFTNDDSAASILSTTEASLPIPLHPTLYTCSQAVTIADNSSQPVTLDMGTRATSSLTVVVTDATPDTITAMQIIVSPEGQSAAAATFNPATGYASDTYRYEKTWQKSAVGGTFTNKSLTLAALLTGSEQALNFRINMLNAKGEVCFSREKQDITFKPASTIKCSGTIFSGDIAGSFLFDTTEGAALPISLD